MESIKNKVKNLKIAVACTLTEPWMESDLDDVLRTIDSIFSEDYLQQVEDKIYDRQRSYSLYPGK